MMPRLRLLLVLTAAAVVSLAVAAAPPAAAGKSCRMKGSRTILKTKKVRVFSKETATRLKTYGCLAKTGRKVRLDRWSDEKGSGRFVVRGRYVGYVGTYHFCGACTHGFDYMNVVDLQTARVLVHEFAAPGTEPVYVESFVLNAKGATAWIGSASQGPVDVVKVDSTGKTLLDRDPGGDFDSDIPRHSLALSADGTTVYWSNAGRARSAVLR